MASGPLLTPEGDPTPYPQYGIVLDAGSSHTSMFIYKWPADKENDTGIVGQHSSCDVRGEGPPSARCAPALMPTHCRASGRAARSLAGCWVGPLQAGAAGAPTERLGPGPGGGGCGHCHLERNPGE